MGQIEDHFEGLKYTVFDAEGRECPDCRHIAPGDVVFRHIQTS